MTDDRESIKRRQRALAALGRVYRAEEHPRDWTYVLAGIIIGMTVLYFTIHVIVALLRR